MFYYPHVNEVAMRYNITGELLQFANIEMEPNEDIFAVSGSMAYMTGNVTMDSKLEGGILKSIKRAVGGGASFMVRFKAHGSPGIVGIGSSIPGKIVEIDVGESQWIIQKSAYLGSESTVEMDTVYQKKFPSSVFGDDGLVLQKVSGKGMMFLSSCGDFYSMDLKQGQQYKVSTPRAMAWERSVNYEISSIGSVKATMFGSEGLLVTTLTGPGRIIIQSMSPGELALSLSHIAQDASR